jgi:uncharacterized RDD family membrane protein YckC
MQFSNFWSRTAAFVIDCIVLMILIYFFYNLNPNLMMIPVLLFVIPIMYNIVMITRWQASIGKLLIGLRIYNQYGETPSWKQVLVRTLIALPSYILILPIFALFFSDEKQTLHDRISKTVVGDFIRWRDKSEGEISLLGRINTLCIYLGNTLFVAFFIIYLIFMTVVLKSIPSMEIDNDLEHGNINVHSSLI